MLNSIGLVARDKIYVNTVDGKRVMAKQVSSSNAAIDLSNYENGTYIVKINNAIVQIQKN